MSGRNVGTEQPEELPHNRRGSGGGISMPGLPGAVGALEPDPTSRRDPLAWAIVLMGSLVAFLTLWWFFGLGNPDLSNRLTGIAAAPCGVIVTLVAIRLRRTARLDPRTRRTWSIVTIALIGYGFGALLHFAATYAPALDPLWPVSLGLEIAAYPLVAVALALLPKPANTVYDIILFSLDVVIVAWSATMLIWHFFIFPAARDAPQPVVSAIVAAFFPVFDLALVFAIGAIILRGLPVSSRAALFVAGAALSFIFVGDMISGLETAKGGYTPGGASGVLYSVAWLGLAVAAYLQWRIKDRERPSRGLADYARSFPWLPYVAVAVGFTAPVIHDWNDIDMLRQHVPATGFLIALVVARLWVTARQNASLAAAERGRLAAAVDQAGEAVLTTDRTGSVTYVNPAFSRITGFSAEEVVGRSPDFLREAADPAQIAEMRALLGRGESWEGRLIERRSDGATVEIDTTIAPLRDAAGAIVGTVELARDISRERALETQLAQAQRMEAVGRLAGGIAHDFNNILTAISGFGELAAAELPSDHPVAEDIGQILRASDRAAALTRALLAFSRRQVMRARPIDLNDVLEGLTPMLGRVIGEDVQLTVRLDKSLGLIMADRAQLEQVVLNLAVNARDAMPAGGELTIATANTDLDAAYARGHVGALEGPYVSLTVSDTGVGMTPEVLEHAFEPFFTTKARGRGTGLGLSTVIGIVQQSGGLVDVLSEPNVGSSFTVHLPRVEGVVAPDEAGGEEGRSPGGNETILVAEDEDAVRTFVARVLVGAGYRVVTAANAAEALSAAGDLPRLDLLFTDVVMPGMSGVELAARLTRTHPGLPAIYASGYSDEGVLPDAADPARTGDVPYLPKPFTSETLLARVREVLDQRRPSEGQPAPGAGPVE
jgi:PAS domain S-box-containing protein